MTEDERQAIASHVASLGVDEWRGLDSEERELVRRALAPASRTDDRATPAA